MPFVRRHRTYYKYGTEPNVTVVGSPTISNGVASGFTTGNYLTAPAFAPNSNPWEIRIKMVCPIIATGGDDYIWTSIADGYGFIFGTSLDKFVIFASSNGSSWNIISGVEGTYSIAPNTDYYVKAGWNGAEYYVEYSLDDVEYIRDITIANTTAIYQNTAKMKFGDWLTYGIADHTLIDLTQSYIKINNKDWWHGTKAVETTKDDADFHVDNNKLYQLAAVKRSYWKYQHQNFVQPVLTADGTLGGKSFAVSADPDADDPAWQAFDSDTASSHCAFTTSTGYLIFYNPRPLKVTKLTVKNWVGNTYGVRAWKVGKVWGSNDNSSYIEIKSFTNDVVTGSASWDIDLSSNTSSYKYYKITVSSTSSPAAGVSHQSIASHITIIAQEQIVVAGTSTDYDYYTDRLLRYEIIKGVK